MGPEFSWTDLRGWVCAVAISAIFWKIITILVRAVREGWKEYKEYTKNRRDD